MIRQIPETVKLHLIGLLQMAYLFYCEYDDYYRLVLEISYSTPPIEYNVSFLMACDVTQTGHVTCKIRLF